MQKTLYGYNKKQIMAKLSTVETISGGHKTVVCLPTFANTLSHWNVTINGNALHMQSGLINKVII